MTEETIRLEIPSWVYRLCVIMLLITLGTASYIYTGWLMTVPVLLVGIGALVAWSYTTYRLPRKRRILPLYITLVIILLLQGLEQWYGGYVARLLALFSTNFAPPVVYSETIHLYAFTFCAIALFLLAAVGIFFHHPLGNYMGWFVMLYGIVGGVLLLALPLLAGATFQYVPGMISAVFAIGVGVLGSVRLCQTGELQGVLS